MRSGLFWGAVGAVRQLVEQLTGNRDAEVFLTGGAGPITCFNKITSRPSTRPSKFVIQGLVSPANVIPTSFEPSLRLVLASRHLTRHVVIQFWCPHDLSLQTFALDRRVAG